MNKRLIIIAAIVIVLIIGSFVGFLIFNTNAPGTPTKTIVPQGETVDPVNNAGGKDAVNQQDSTVDNTSGQTQLPAPTAAQLSFTIADSSSDLKDANGSATFSIVRMVNPLPGWYVVSIDTGSGQGSKVILKQTDDPKNPLTVVAGPGTSFPADIVTLPDAVRKATLS